MLSESFAEAATHGRSPSFFDVKAVLAHASREGVPLQLIGCSYEWQTDSTGGPTVQQGSLKIYLWAGENAIGEDTQSIGVPVPIETGSQDKILQPALETTFAIFAKLLSERLSGSELSIWANDLNAVAVTRGSWTVQTVQGAASDPSIRSETVPKSIVSMLIPCEISYRLEAASTETQLPQESERL